MKMLPLHIFLVALMPLVALSESEVTCSTKQCKMYCANGFKKDANGCDICECNVLDVCSEVQCPDRKVCRVFTLDHTGHKISKCIDPTLPPKCWGVADTGYGRVPVTRHFYNSDTDECEPFQYSGRGGNENRFENKEVCLGTCIKGLCEPVQCMMDCGQLGFKEDKKGCQMCDCNEPAAPSPTPQPGNACPDVMCAMYCEYGFVKGDDGCDRCECRQKPATQPFTPGENCPVQECRMFCELGFLEENGCPICSCKEPSCPEIECAMRCKYGFLRNKEGCSVCTCAEDPCSYVASECPADRPKCKSIKRPNMRWEPRCVSERERFWCSDIMCMMECENGFTNDRYGCSICECRAEPKPECPMVRCGGQCNYGYKFGSDGCRGCECLPDPCLEYKCSVDEVCEAYRDKKYTKARRGSVIPAMPKCIPDMDVQRLEVELKYSYDSDVYQLFENEAEFEQELKASIGRMMYIDDEYIRGISVRSAGPQECSVTVNLISYGERNLVDALEELKQKLSVVLDSSFDCGGATFVPIQDSVEARYYSDPEITTQDISPTAEPEGSNTMFIIIGCVIGGVVALAATIAIIIIVVRSRKRHEEARKNIAYSKVRKTPPKGRPESAVSGAGSRPQSSRPQSARPVSQNV